MGNATGMWKEGVLDEDLVIGQTLRFGVIEYVRNRKDNENRGVCASGTSLMGTSRMEEKKKIMFLRYFNHNRYIV